jgi:hypothetical protein
MRPHANAHSIPQSHTNLYTRDEDNDDQFEDKTVWVATR